MRSSSVSRPLRKQLWRQLVVAKIRGAGRELADRSARSQKLLALAREVRSGDPTNIEAQAARVYWANWLWDREESRRSRLTATARCERRVRASAAIRICPASTAS